MPATLARPDASTYDAYFQRYLDLVPGDCAITAMTALTRESEDLIAGLDEKAAAHRYAPGKWSVKEVIGHLVDCERVFQYRALRLARDGGGDLPGFDHDRWGTGSDWHARTLASIADEYRAVRRSSIELFRGLPASNLERVGICNGKKACAASSAWLLIGHDRHHMGVVREKYLGR